MIMWRNDLRTRAAYRKNTHTEYSISCHERKSDIEGVVKSMTCCVMIIHSFFFKKMTKSHVRLISSFHLFFTFFLSTNKYKNNAKRTKKKRYHLLTPIFFKLLPHHTHIPST